MAVTNQELLNIFLENPNMSDAQIVSLMEAKGINPEQISSTFNIPLAEVESRYNAALPFANPQIEERVVDTGEGTRSEYYIKGTNIQADAPTFTETSPTTGLTESSAPQFQANNFTIYDPQAKGEYVYTPEGKLIGFNPGERGSGFGSFLNEVYQDNKGVIIPALTFGALNAAGLLGGAAGTAGMSAAELAQLDLALGGAGGTAGATSLGNALATGANVGTLTNLTGGSNAGLLTNTGTGLTTNTGILTGGSDVVGMGGGTGLKVGTTGLDTITATNAGLNSGLTTGANTGLLTTVGTTLAGIDTGVTAANAANAAKIASDAALAKKILDTGNTITSGLKTVGGLLQTEEDKAAAQLAAQNVTAATQAGVEGSQFRPVGMTTRFGTSNYTYDPVTGRMTSAGYQLSPEAKNAQDRLVALAGRGLTQAEAAQQQFAPLQTGAQNLFGLGNQYISQSPQDVAQNYINQQMQLLQPSREMELANLQNRLQQQGRAGLSVAQGGSLGATTPELQALYNARAQQELQLAANAQQAGQQNVLFGAGLLGQGSQAMGNYYGGQQAAYSPYTTALGQVQNLETQAQQPLAIGANLAQQASTAGYRAGSLGVQGAQAAGALSTGKAATTNPYASLLSGFDPAFAQGIAKQIWGA